MQPEDGMEEVALSHEAPSAAEDGWDADTVGWAADESPQAHPPPDPASGQALARPSPEQHGPDLEAQNAGLQARLKAVESVRVPAAALHSSHLWHRRVRLGPAGLAASAALPRSAGDQAFPDISDVDTCVSVLLNAGRIWSSHGTGSGHTASTPTCKPWLLIVLMKAYCVTTHPQSVISI